MACWTPQERRVAVSNPGYHCCGQEQTVGAGGVGRGELPVDIALPSFTGPPAEHLLRGKRWCSRDGGAVPGAWDAERPQCTSPQCPRAHLRKQRRVHVRVGDQHRMRHEALRRRHTAAPTDTDRGRDGPDGSGPDPAHAPGTPGATPQHRSHPFPRGRFLINMPPNRLSREAGSPSGSALLPDRTQNEGAIARAGGSERSGTMLHRRVTGSNPGNRCCAHDQTAGASGATCGRGTYTNGPTPDSAHAPHKRVGWMDGLSVAGGCFQGRKRVPPCPSAPSKLKPKPYTHVTVHLCDRAERAGSASLVGTPSPSGDSLRTRCRPHAAPGAVSDTDTTPGHRTRRHSTATAAQPIDRRGTPGRAQRRPRRLEKRRDGRGEDLKLGGAQHVIERFAGVLDQRPLEGDPANNGRAGPCAREHCGGGEGGHAACL